MKRILKLLFRPIYAMGLSDAAQLAQDYAYDIIGKPDDPDPLRACAYSHTAQMVAASNIASLIRGRARTGKRFRTVALRWRFGLFLIVALFAVTVEAQTGTFVEAGLSGSYGSNEKRVSFPELYGVVSFKLFEFNGATVQLRARGRYAKTPDYADLFTRDSNPERRATGELVLDPAARLNFSKETFFKPFVDAGVEYRRQFGLSGAPYSGLNPTLTIGTRAGYGYEVFYTRLFDDRFGRSKLRGDRLGVSYSLKLAGDFHFKFGAEAERVSYRACSNVDCDGYREYDWLGRPFVAISIY